MGGFFGVVSTQDCIGDLFFGTDYHSHLGTKRGGLAVAFEDGRFLRRIHDITNAPFRSKFDDEIGDFSGARQGIGVISDCEDQPLLIASHLGTYALVTVSRINNVKELTERAFRHGHSHFAEMGDGQYNATELVSMLINEKDSIADGITYAQGLIDGSCSILLMTKDALYAARDRYGRTPVILGRKENGFCVTQETTALPNLDYSLHYELGPGEIVRVNADQVIQERAPGDQMKICAFLWVYYGYPSSCYEGVNAEEARNRNGAMLAESDPVKDDIDSVCGIPDSGVAHAIGFSNACGKPYERAFVKYTPTWPRSFMPQNQKMRELVARMKLIPVMDKIKGKKLLFCDDSIVRGTQLRDTVRRLYERGAKEVHMRSACPPLVYGCRYLNFSQSRSEMDLAARRAIAKLEGTGEPTEEQVAAYTEYGSEKYEKMVDQVRKELNLTTLRFQKLELLLQAIGIDPDKVCTYCWTGHDVDR